MSHSRGEILDFLYFLENKYPVNKITANGLLVWPILKIELFFLLNREYSGGPKKNTNRNLNPLLVVYKGIKSAATIFSKRSKRPSVLYCGASHFRFSEKGKYKSRYYNQLAKGSRDAGMENLFLEYENNIDNYSENLEDKENTFFTYLVSPLLHILKKIVYQLSPPNWEGVPDLEKIFKETEQFCSSRVILDIKTFGYDITYLELSKRIFKWILKKNKIEKVYMLCYYNKLIFPMCVAARELNIDTIDIQHGGQGKNHVAYSNWSVIPEKGYYLLPKFFWCWDESSADIIRDWQENQEFHQVEVKGNPWVDFCMEEMSQLIPTEKRIVLFTLQPTGDELLEPYLIDAIKNTPDNFEWWLRLHPRQMKQKEELQNILLKKNILDKTNLKQANELPLPVLLINCHVHISKFSGSILEAYLLNKKSILLSKLGVEMYPEVIKSGLGTFINEDYEALVREIVRSQVEKNSCE